MESPDTMPSERTIMTEKTCQHRRWYKLPSGKMGSVDCGKPAKERSRFVGSGIGITFNMIEDLCDKHAKEDS
jgi:hypothetical protein